jgi:hypothetical protein
LRSLRLLRNGGIGPLCLRILGHGGTGNLSPACRSTGRHLGACTIVSFDMEARRTLRVERHIEGGSPRLLLPSYCPLLPSRRPGFPPRRSVDWWVRLSSASLAVVVVATVIMVGAPSALRWCCHQGWFLRVFSVRRRRQKREVREVEPLLARLLDAPRGPPTTWVPPSCLLPTSPSISKKSGPHPAKRGGAANCVR